MYTPYHITEIGNRAERTVLLLAYTYKGTAETGDSGNPTSRGARSRCLRTSDYRASYRRKERLRGLILIIVFVIIVGNRYHTLDFG